MFLKIALDVLLTLILLVGIYLGYRRGFVKSVAGPVRFFASLATAYWLADPISQNLLEPIIRTPVTNQIKGYLIENCPAITPESAADELPTLLKFAASLLGVDTTSLSSENTITAIVDSLASPIVHLVSVIITFVLVYFLAKLVYSILISLIASFFSSGVLGLPNKILGCVFSFFFAVIFAWILTLGFDFVIHSSLFAESAWAQEFEGGIIYRFFNMTNPVDILLSF